MPTKGEKVLADKLLNRTVVSQSGKTFGLTDDLLFETNSGEIIYLVLKNPTPYAKTFDLEKTPDGELKIPYNAVLAIGDFVVIAEEDIV
ncbi:hypothetical protein COX58_02120 [archaeon CG_4_10_14_0_2_um_filter_Archaea_38_6]|nr:MAG: hypothetical protein COS83_04725 [archaeon CG07_land_8_20_14_0_80_38_8]PIU89280.1 MAG: hypothetical protein COS64_01205 [archaeon CG06_land_8_20_14_3_00_37_11]PIX43222.1 MAG: hypothetical protein COZ55_01405 [archaeon CG_4_8_14_3_um_filter_38_5]PJA22491.1 MAG: hypothetical protein COX58_02120 [archaeon CG_4_10_14_0_2_um_filter_Archaea_38_6]